eukprot:757786-Hanusia_phi.AAC.1
MSEHVTKQQQRQGGGGGEGKGCWSTSEPEQGQRGGKEREDERMGKGTERKKKTNRQREAAGLPAREPAATVDEVRVPASSYQRTPSLPLPLSLPLLPPCLPASPPCLPPPHHPHAPSLRSPGLCQPLAGHRRPVARLASD